MGAPRVRRRPDLRDAGRGSDRRRRSAIPRARLECRAVARAPRRRVHHDLCAAGRRGRGGRVRHRGRRVERGREHVERPVSTRSAAVRPAPSARRSREGRAAPRAIDRLRRPRRALVAGPASMGRPVRAGARRQPCAGRRRLRQQRRRAQHGFPAAAMAQPADGARRRFRRRAPQLPHRTPRRGTVPTVPRMAPAGVAGTAGSRGGRRPAWSRRPRPWGIRGRTLHRFRRTAFRGAKHAGLVRAAGHAGHGFWLPWRLVPRVARAVRHARATDP